MATTRTAARTGDVSKVWFSIVDGALTETMYGLIHEKPRSSSCGWLVKTATGLAVEGADTTGRQDRVPGVDAAARPPAEARPPSRWRRPSPRTSRGRFEIEKRIFTDPDRNALFVRDHGPRPEGPGPRRSSVLEPHMANTGGGDTGAATDRRPDGSMKARRSSARRAASRFVKAVATPLGAGALSAVKAATLTGGASAIGAIVLTAELPRQASGEATYELRHRFRRRTPRPPIRPPPPRLKTGYDEVLARYNGEGDRVGWEDYLASLTELPRLREASEDGGKLVQASALMLKVQEDRTYAGALIASLSNPWGDTVDASKPSTGYKAVWPRDFYQCAMALVALGDTQTPLAAFRYLPQVQVKADTPGNTGAAAGSCRRPGWTAPPNGSASSWTRPPCRSCWAGSCGSWAGCPRPTSTAYYGKMIKPAADFLVDGGKVGLGWNDARPSARPAPSRSAGKSRSGHSPSTTAADHRRPGRRRATSPSWPATRPAAARYRATADDYSSKVEARMVTTSGDVGRRTYYVRINQNEDPNDHAPIGAANGQIGAAQGPGGRRRLPRAGPLRRARGPMTPPSSAACPSGRHQTRRPLPRALRLHVPGVERRVPA